MTIIVGLETEDGVILGCDSQGSTGWDKRYREDSKIFEVDDIGYGFTTSYRMGQILKYHMTPSFSPAREKDPFGFVVGLLIPKIRLILQEHGFTEIVNNKGCGGTFLVVVGGSLFYIDSDFQVAQYTDGYTAIGCGASYSLGYLHGLDESGKLWQREEDDVSAVIRAVNCAIKFSNGCGGAIKTMSIKK